MKFKNSLLFFFASILLSGFHCKKDKTPEEQLPPETQIGANTFGCKINDTIYVAKGTPFTCPAYDVQYYKSAGTLLIKTSNTCAKGLNIYVYNVLNVGDYQIFNPISNAFLYATSTYSSCNGYDRSNSTQTGTITITKLDSPNKIVSGRFYGVLKISGCPDVNLTEGRFDFKMTVFN